MSQRRLRLVTLMVKRHFQLRLLVLRTRHHVAMETQPGLPVGALTDPR